MKKLPKDVEQVLNSSPTLNIFGCVNIGALKARTGCEIPDEELKQMIQNRFGKEMHNGEVEFINK